MPNGPQVDLIRRSVEDELPRDSLEVDEVFFYLGPPGSRDLIPTYHQ